MLTMLGINKILALYVGPSGYAALGQFQNVVQMISTVAGGATNTGVTKYTAEYQDDHSKQRRVWKTAGTIAIISSAVLSILVIISREHLAKWFLNDTELSIVFVFFAASLTLFVLNALLLAILNGKKDISRYVVANIVGSLSALLITIVMVTNWGLIGALIALTVYQSLAFFATLALCIKTKWFNWGDLFGRVEPLIAKNLAKYAAMALTTAAAVPLSHILIRNHLGETLGWEAAGYWEAMWRLSGAYLMMASTTLSIYYLPKLSELQTADEIKQEIINGYRIILPSAIACSILVYSLQDLIILNLFSAEFLPMKQLFFWQLIGDIFKIAGWLFAFVMLGRTKTKLYIITEIFFSLNFWWITIILTEEYGLIGVSIAHLINYALYLIIVGTVIYKKL